MVCESLPLRFLALGVELYVRGVGLVNKAEVGRYLEHTQLISKVSLPQADKIVLYEISKRRRKYLETNKIKCSGICGIKVLQKETWYARVRDVLSQRLLFQLSGI